MEFLAILGEGVVMMSKGEEEAAVMLNLREGVEGAMRMSLGEVGVEVVMLNLRGVAVGAESRKIMREGEGVENLNLKGVVVGVAGLKIRGKGVEVVDPKVYHLDSGVVVEEWLLLEEVEVVINLLRPLKVEVEAEFPCLKEVEEEDQLRWMVVVEEDLFMEVEVILYY